MSRRFGAALLIACLSLLAAAPAQAENVSSAQLHTLATQAAAGDQLALAQLRTVTAVDGQPAQVAAALNGAGPAELHARLVALAATAPAAPTTSPDSARQTAASLLDAGRYKKTSIPDPINSALQHVARFLVKLASRMPGGPVVFWGIAGAIVLALAALAARRVLRRLEPATGTAGTIAAASEDPAALEREAQAAEARGAFDEAIRLRFRAGLLQLSERAAIDYRPSLLNGDVARTLHSSDFDSLARTFDRVAYGGEPAEPGDAQAAREGWRDVLARAGASS